MYSLYFNSATFAFSGASSAPSTVRTHVHACACAPAHVCTFHCVDTRAVLVELERGHAADPSGLGDLSVLVDVDLDELHAFVT